MFAGSEVSEFDVAFGSSRRADILFRFLVGDEGTSTGRAPVGGEGASLNGESPINEGGLEGMIVECVGGLVKGDEGEPCAPERSS
jgi:hypothetical protein